MTSSLASTCAGGSSAVDGAAPLLIHDVISEMNCGAKSAASFSLKPSALTRIVWEARHHAQGVVLVAASLQSLPEESQAFAWSSRAVLFAEHAQQWLAELPEIGERIVRGPTEEPCGDQHPAEIDPDRIEQSR
ncbi:hypothetical protein Kfla_4539 [Kribbella flavida DSM 17836]|uniref:Uncharacterized protein n=1 Tax=Kribbella flavida (strain DSM 17836 / JCM 10339 / NBRC 14399) TaxID=479435 RepID=D2PXV9_KRIFD|nr:hypothetical protein [Kribbella flavida]ADB33565.1 hypothetical protein Kfla_4539 [Kribbella flavida DSM 17836]